MVEKCNHIAKIIYIYIDHLIYIYLSTFAHFSAKIYQFNNTDIVIMLSSAFDNYTFIYKLTI